MLYRYIGGYSRTQRNNKGTHVLILECIYIDACMCMHIYSS